LHLVVIDDVVDDGADFFVKVASQNANSTSDDQ
jgi:hypothetical protein